MSTSNGLLTANHPRNHPPSPNIYHEAYMKNMRDNPLAMMIQNSSKNGSEGGMENGMLRGQQNPPTPFPQFSNSIAQSQPNQSQFQNPQTLAQNQAQINSVQMNQSCQRSLLSKQLSQPSTQSSLQSFVFKPNTTSSALSALLQAEGASQGYSPSTPEDENVCKVTNSIGIPIPRSVANYNNFYSSSFTDGAILPQESFEYPTAQSFPPPESHSFPQYKPYHSVNLLKELKKSQNSRASLRIRRQLDISPLTIPTLKTPKPKKKPGAVDWQKIRARVQELRMKKKNANTE